MDNFHWKLTGIIVYVLWRIYSIVNSLYHSGTLLSMVYTHLSCVGSLGFPSSDWARGVVYMHWLLVNQDCMSLVILLTLSWGHILAEPMFGLKTDDCKED